VRKLGEYARLIVSGELAAGHRRCRAMPEPSPLRSDGNYFLVVLRFFFACFPTSLRAS
jgi:hypothetical protein